MGIPKLTKKVIDTVRSMSREASRKLDMMEVAAIITNYAKGFLGADYGALFLIDADDNKKHLMLIGAAGLKKNQIENLKILGSWECVNDEVIKEKKAVIVNNVLSNKLFRNENLPFCDEKINIGSFIAVPINIENKVIGTLIISNKGKKRKFSTDDKKFLYTLINQVSSSILNAKLYRDLKKLYLNTVTSLAAAIDARDQYTMGHSERVSDYAVAIARELKCKEKFTEDIKLAGILHDVGKIGVKDSILSKKGRLNLKEVIKMHEHPVIGANIVSSVIKSKTIINGILQHHERFDGHGYPKGIKGNKISLEGRVIAVADTFDTLVTKRPYKKPYTAKEAIIEIVRSEKTDFDPRIVRAFQISVSKYPHFWRFG